MVATTAEISNVIETWKKYYNSKGVVLGNELDNLDLNKIDANTKIKGFSIIIIKADEGFDDATKWSPFVLGRINSYLRDIKDGEITALIIFKKDNDCSAISKIDYETKKITLIKNNKKGEKQIEKSSFENGEFIIILKDEEERISAEKPIETKKTKETETDEFSAYAYFHPDTGVLSVTITPKKEIKELKFEFDSNKTTFFDNFSIIKTKQDNSLEIETKELTKSITPEKEKKAEVLFIIKSRKSDVSLKLNGTEILIYSYSFKKGFFGKSKIETINVIPEKINADGSYLLKIFNEIQKKPFDKQDLSEYIKNIKNETENKLLHLYYISLSENEKISNLNNMCSLYTQNFDYSEKDINDFIKKVKINFDNRDQAGLFISALVNNLNEDISIDLGDKAVNYLGFMHSKNKLEIKTKSEDFLEYVGHSMTEGEIKLDGNAGIIENVKGGTLNLKKCRMILNCGSDKDNVKILIQVEKIIGFSEESSTDQFAIKKIGKNIKINVTENAVGKIESFSDDTNNKRKIIINGFDIIGTPKLKFLFDSPLEFSLTGVTLQTENYLRFLFSKKTSSTEYFHLEKEDYVKLNNDKIKTQIKDKIGAYIDFRNLKNLNFKIYDTNIPDKISIKVGFPFYTDTIEVQGEKKLYTFGIISRTFPGYTPSGLLLARFFTSKTLDALKGKIKKFIVEKITNDKDNYALLMKNVGNLDEDNFDKFPLEEYLVLINYYYTENPTSFNINTIKIKIEEKYKNLLKDDVITYLRILGISKESKIDISPDNISNIQEIQDKLFVAVKNNEYCPIIKILQVGADLKIQYFDFAEKQIKELFDFTNYKLLIFKER